MIGWLDLLAVQGTLKSLLQHHSLKASILQRSAFFMVQLSHQYMTTGKTIDLTIWTFVSKSCLCLVYRFVIAFLPRGKSLLIFRPQSPSAVILEPKKLACHCFHLFAMKWWDRMPGSWFFECWVLSQLFHSLLSHSSTGSLVPLHFLSQGGVSCMSEVIDISLGNLDYNVYFIQSSICHDVLCIEVK